jgi:hypothetical protein
MSEKEITEEYDKSLIDTIGDDHKDYEDEDDMDDDFYLEEYDVFQSIEYNFLLDPDDDDSEYDELDF